MPELLAALDAFLQEHRGCRDQDGGVERGHVWMACDWTLALPSYSPSPSASPWAISRSIGP